MPCRAQRVCVYLRTSWFSGIITDGLIDGTANLSTGAGPRSIDGGRRQRPDRRISLLDTNRTGRREHGGHQRRTDREVTGLPGGRFAGHGARFRRQPDTQRLAELSGAEIGKADADAVRQATGYSIGGVPPIGFPAPIPTFIDRDLLQYDVVWAAAGT
ncbi:MAG: hypothetical protein E6I78_02175, partial [Chloroflexi bacterium]